MLLFVATEKINIQFFTSIIFQTCIIKIGWQRIENDGHLNRFDQYLTLLVLFVVAVLFTGYPAEFVLIGLFAGYLFICWSI